MSFENIYFQLISTNFITLLIVCIMASAAVHRIYEMIPALHYGIMIWCAFVLSGLLAHMFMQEHGISITGDRAFDVIVSSVIGMSGAFLLAVIVHQMLNLARLRD